MSQQAVVHPSTKRFAWAAPVLLLGLYAAFLVTYGAGLWGSDAQDFPSFYFAPRLAFEKGLTPFNHDNWAVVYTITDEWIWPFLYPPPSLVLFRLYNLFTFEAAKNLHLLLNHALVVAFGAVFLGKIMRLKPAGLLGASLFAYVLLFRPLGETLKAGQVNLLILLLVCLSWYWVQSGRRPALAGLSLALATLIKLYPALLIGYLLVKGKYKVAAWSLFFLAALTVLTLPFLPPGAWADWQSNVAGQGYGSWVRGLDPAMLANQSINGFTARFFLGRADYIRPVFPSTLAARTVPFVLSGLVGLVSLLVVLPFVNKRARPEAQAMEFSLFLLVMCLAAPISWEHQLVFILPAVLIALHRELARTELNWVGLVVVFLAAGLLAFTRLPHVQLPLSHPQAMLVSTKGFAVGVLWLYYVQQLWTWETNSASQAELEPPPTPLAHPHA